MSDNISRADAICEILVNDGIDNIVDRINALPSADAVKVAYICDGRACNGDCTSEECTHTKDIEHAKNFIRIGDAYMESADAVPQLKQTDTLIIADALRYLAKDTERHLVDRTRADALRQQFLKYGASMCKGGDPE